MLACLQRSIDGDLRFNCAGHFYAFDIDALTPSCSWNTISLPENIFDDPDNSTYINQQFVSCNPDGWLYRLEDFSECSPGMDRANSFNSTHHQLGQGM